MGRHLIWTRDGGGVGTQWRHSFHWSMRNECPSSLYRGLLGKILQYQGQQSSSGPPNLLAIGLGFLSFLSPVHLHWLFSTFSSLLKHDTHLSKFSSFSINGPSCHLTEKIKGIIKSPLSPAANVTVSLLFQALPQEAKPRASVSPLPEYSVSMKKYSSPSFQKISLQNKTHLQQPPYLSSSWPNSLELVYLLTTLISYSFLSSEQPSSWIKFSHEIATFSEVIPWIICSHSTLDFGTIIISVIVRLLSPQDCKLSYSRAWVYTQCLQHTGVHVNEINIDSLVTESVVPFILTQKPFCCLFIPSHSSQHSFLHSFNKYLWLWTTCRVLFQKPRIYQWKEYKFLRKVYFGGEDRCKQWK